MVVIPNGYDLSVFEPNVSARDNLRSELGLLTEPTIGFVARFNPLKDHDNLLNALALLSARQACPRCLLVGTGMDESNAWLTGRIAELGLSDRIVLLGRRDDIPSVMNALDLHVMSSSSEAFPNVLAEAMACGTPCVSTDVGDAALIVGETGWIVPPETPEALADAIEGALRERQEHPEAWRARCAAARQRVVDEFSIDRMVQRYRDIWASAL